MLSELQKCTAQAIVNIYETGSVLGDYGCIAVVEKDPGHLTYGRSQTTLASGNLHTLIQQYCDAANARFAKRLRQWLPQLQAKNFALDADKQLHNVLRAASDDPVMRNVQDGFFDSCYWDTAAQTAQRAGLSCALGIAVAYDSTVHGSWDLIRKRTNQQIGTIDVIGEQQWIRAYVRTRREWLANHANSLLRKTTYRMDAFNAMLDLNNWNLDLPLVVRGAEISSASLKANPSACFDGPAVGSRALDTQQSPLPRGLDVRLLQLALSDWGANVKADGIFGPGTAACLSDYQKAKGLPANGAADPNLVKQMAAGCYG